jgi:ribosomal protein S27AE
MAISALSRLLTRFRREQCPKCGHSVRRLHCDVCGYDVIAQTRDKALRSR